jgi:hypothetical protein
MSAWSKMLDVVAPYEDVQPARQQRHVYVQQGPTSSVHYEKQPMAHTMHLLLTILTCGIWGVFVWLPLGLAHSMSRGRKVTTKYR